MNRFILSQRAMGHDQKRLEEAVSDFINGLELSTKSISNSDEIMVKGIGKTVAQSQQSTVPKQEEKELPGVKNEDGWRYDPSAKGGPGMKLELFPTMAKRKGLDKSPNFGWVEDKSTDAPKDFNERIAKMLQKPVVTLDVYEVDSNGEPTRKLSKREVEEQNAESVKSIGRSIRERNPAGGLAQRAARRFKVVVDDLGKFRCPPGTPQANQFTDKFGSTCFALSAGEIRAIAQRGLESLGSWWEHQRATGYGRRHLLDESGNFITDARSYREELARPKARWLKNARTRGQARMVEMEDAVDNLIKELGIEVTPEQRAENYHLHLAFKKLKEMGLWDVDIVNDLDDIKAKFGAMSEKDREKFKKRGVTFETLAATERGVLTRVLETYLRDPQVAKEIKRVSFSGEFSKSGVDFLGENVEGMAYVLNQKDNIADAKFAIAFDLGDMTMNAANQIPAVKKGQRLGVNVEGANTEEERAAAIADFVANQEMFAGGMAAAVAVDGRIGKGVHTAAHEIGHVIQMMQWKKVMLRNYSNKQLSEMNSQQIAESMKALGDGIDMVDLNVTLQSLEAVAILGGKYPLDEYSRDGITQLWAIELSAELYALRDMEIIQGDDIDAALEWMDRTAKAKDATHRANTRKRQMALVEKEMSKPMMDGDRPDFPSDEDMPKTPKKPPTKFVGKKDADEFGKKTRRSAIKKLGEQEGGAIERIGDPVDARVASLIGTNPSRDILAIHKDNKRLKRIGVIPDKFDINEGSVSEQVEHTLIPTLSALDKTTLPDNLVVRFQPKNSFDEGDILSIPDLRSFQLEHDELGSPPGTITIELGTDARGILVPSSPFDSSADESGKFGRVMLPPGRVVITGTDADGVVTARLIDQETSSQSLQRMIDNWPAKGDSKFEDGILRREKASVQKLVDNHNEKIRASGGEVLPDGRSNSILAREIRTNNTDIVDRVRRSGGKPTRPDREYVDGLASKPEYASSGFDDALGQVSTPIERRIDRDKLFEKMLADIKNEDLWNHPQIRDYIDPSSINEDTFAQVEQMVFDFHDTVDRRPRVRTDSEQFLEQVFSSSGMARKNAVEYHSRIGIHPDTPDEDRPVSGYVVHKSQRDMTVNALKKKGIVAGDMPFEYESENTPYGNIGADGDIELILRPEVSGRTAYGFGRGPDQQTRPVWMNSDDPDDIVDALLHPTAENYQARFANAIISTEDNDLGSFLNTSSIRPPKSSPDYDTEIEKFNADLSGQQPLGAHIMGGYKKEEISAVVHPWSKIQSSSKDVDISDAIEQEPISERLSRLGFSPEEIQYFYSLNGNSLGSINTSAMQQLRAFRKSQEISDRYKKMGIPEVQFSHKHGTDMLSPRAYSLSNQDEGDVEDILQTRIQAEIDNELKAALKKIQKTRNELAEIKI